MTDEDFNAAIKLRSKLGEVCEGFTIGQIIYALIILTTDVFMQAAEETPRFISNVTEFTCDIIKLHATYSAQKDSDDNIKVH
jgi:hypothetical protein